MKLFNCKVRLRGDVRDEVRKYDVTSAEITVLRSIHGGDDAVLEVTEVGNADRSDAKERDRLETVYGEKLINKIFGVPQVRISDEITAENSVQRIRRPRAPRDMIDDPVALAAAATSDEHQPAI